MGFFAFDRIPDQNRGSALGTQNAIVLVVAPVAVFATSVVVELLGVGIGAALHGFVPENWFAQRLGAGQWWSAVSYTHLTLPTT